MKDAHFKGCRPFIETQLPTLSGAAWQPELHTDAQVLPLTNALTACQVHQLQLGPEHRLGAAGSRGGTRGRRWRGGGAGGGGGAGEELVRRLMHRACPAAAWAPPFPLGGAASHVPLGPLQPAG